VTALIELPRGRNKVLDLRSASFSTSLPTRSIRAVLQFVETDDYRTRALMIEGGVGCGKTHALRALLRYLLIEKARGNGIEEIHFYPFPRLVTLLLNNTERAATLERACEADDLIVDDWGSTYVKRDGMVAGLIEEIVIHREARQYSMVASTNLVPKEFRKAFGERIYDRWAGRWGSWIRVHGPSLRRKREVRS